VQCNYGGGLLRDEILPLLTITSTNLCEVHPAPPFVRRFSCNPFHSHLRVLGRDILAYVYCASGKDHRFPLVGRDAVQCGESA
jgi:hypothetical protein